MSSKLISPTLRAVVNLNSSKLNAETSKLASAYLSSAPAGGKHELPALKYDYAALQPSISAETMTIHHTKHHQTYVTNLNASLEKLDAAVSASDSSAIISLASALKFNGGGHINHTLFWENLTSKDSSEFPDGGVLKEAVVERFGSLEEMKKDLGTKSIGVQGSGWGWLGYDASTGRIETATCSNQDPLQPTTGLIPLLGIDVWEHAYYVDYRNVRPNYVNAIWDVIDWKVVEERLACAKK